MGFLFFQCKTAFSINICHVISKISQLPFDTDHLKIADYYNSTLPGHFVYKLVPCHEDLILARKSHNCTGTAFVQFDSTSVSKLIEQSVLREGGEI